MKTAIPVICWLLLRTPCDADTKDALERRLRTQRSSEARVAVEVLRFEPPIKTPQALPMSSDLSKRTISRTKPMRPIKIGAIARIGDCLGVRLFHSRTPRP
jgi:hypothetical protein